MKSSPSSTPSSVPPPNALLVLAFNYASSTTTSSFHSSPPLPHQHLISPHLLSQLCLQHGSLAQLKSAFSAAAMGMFTNGYIWFVTDAAGNTAVIPTFGPGSLLVRSRTYMGHSKLLMGSGMLQYDRGDPLMKGDPYMREWTQELAEMITGEKIERHEGENEEYEGESEAHASPTPAPTPKSPPPGVSPSSPASGVSASNNPSNHPLHPRFIHASTPSLTDKNNKNLGEENMIPTSLFDEPTPQNASSFNMGLGLNNAALTPRYQRTLSRSDHYTMAMSKPSGPSSSTANALGLSSTLNISETLYPLFCLSVHEHAWTSVGYGVWGKEAWIKEFWSVVDWERVSLVYEHWTVEEARKEGHEQVVESGLGGFKGWDSVAKEVN
ncbi:hypothetical protein D9758_001422 [Tetrapyrgos nigripes]|uniref:Manganese/iron superoxide dismutase C-terminal domain-containing protein n=1 Tax=Tetrapyrgos nigripes TaxID=182062 RepID=A0A8H5GS25_9AGAR|nr:hypothetical protein D9758_001422 [Tetrapyrgos nigripes]